MHKEQYKTLNIINLLCTKAWKASEDHTYTFNFLSRQKYLFRRNNNYTEFSLKIADSVRFLIRDWTVAK